MNETISVGDYFYDTDKRVVQVRSMSPKGTSCFVFPPGSNFGWKRATVIVRKLQKLTPEEITMYLLRK